MFSTAVTQSSPAFLTFLYSTRNDWMGKPRLPRGIQVTYAEVSVAVETVGLSGASGAVGKKQWCHLEDRADFYCNTFHIEHLLKAHPSVTIEKAIEKKTPC